MTTPTTTDRRATRHGAAAMTATARPAAARRPRTVRRTAALAAAVLAAAAFASTGTAAPELPGGLELVVRDQPAELAGPEAPALGAFPVQLVLDDGGAEGSVGVADAMGAREFLWFNRFDAPPGPGFVLEEVWVLFPVDPNVAPGDAIELAVYQDPDGDPANGADLLATFDVTVQVADGATFSVYPLAAPVTFTGPGDVLIGAVPRFIEPGDPLTSPAAIDNTTSQGRSWLAIWTGDPPDDPELPPDALIITVDDLGFPGNWMIRGFGSELPALEIPALGGAGLAGLAMLLALAGLVFLVRRRSRVTGTLAPAFLLVTAASAGAQPVEIDPFTTVHGPLSAPPTSISTAGPGAMIAAFRDLEIERLSGTGTSTVEVAGGVLTFTAAAGDRARISVLYDGEPTTGFDPSILPAFDMIGFDHGSFRLRAAVTGNPASAVFEVYTDAANWSKAALALPVGAMADHFVDLSELQVAGGTGADLTQVRGLVFRIVAEDGAVVTVEEFFAETPAVTADQADFTDAGAPIGGGSVVPGETFRYRVTIENAGGGAEGVDLSNVLDPALVPGTFRTTPIVRDDQYTGFGNVTLTVDGVTLPGLTANDTDPDGDPIDIVAFDATSAQGGTVALVDSEDGTFTYSPPPGFNGVDSFTYTVGAVAGDPTEDANGNPVGPFTATATIDLDRTVWFVDNTHGGPFEGTQTNPFDELKDAETASGPGDVVRLRRGDGTTTGHDLGMVMKDGQHLIGGGVPLVLDGQTIEPADPGGRPKITHNADGHALQLAAEHVIHGVDVEACDRVGLWGFGVGHVEVREMTIVDAGAEAVLIDDGDLDVELDGVSSNGSETSGLRLANVTGTLTVSGATTILDYGNAGGDGLVVTNSPGAALDFGTTTIDGNSPLGGSGVLGTGGDGISLVSNAGATITFDSLAVTSVSGAGLRADTTGTINVNSTAATIDATGGPAVQIHDTAGQTNGVSGWTFQSLASTDSSGFGVLLDGLTDDFLVTNAVTVDDTNSIAIGVQDSAGRSIDFGTVTALDNNVGGGATGGGVDLAGNNAGAVFTFDNLTLVTDDGFGLRAGASTLAFGAGNFIAANGGPALELDGTTIGGIAPLGGGGADFVEITSVDSVGQGVSLVGVTGEMFVAGGFIQNSTGTAFRVDAGAPVVTYHGTITQPNAALVVEVEGTSGGAVSFPGQVTGTAAALGVRLDGNAGNVSFDGLDLGTAGTPLGSTAVTLVGGSTGLSSFADMRVFTAGATGFLANDGGVVEVTGAGNRVAAASGVAVRMFGGTTVGPNGVTFQRVDASSASHGLELRGIGSAGVFEITGDGPSDPTVTTAGRTTARAGGGTIALGSGGTLTDLTDGAILEAAPGVVLRNLVVGDGTALPGDPVTGASDITDNGLELTGVDGLVLDNVMISRTADHGIQGFGINDGLTLLHTEILNAGDDGAGPTDGDDAIDFKTGIGGPAGPHGLVGTVTIASSILAGMSDTGLEVENFSGDLDLTVGNSLIGNNDHSDASCNPCEGDGFLLRADGGSATIDMVVTDTTFQDVANDGIDLGNDGASNVTTLIAEGIAGVGNDGADNLIDTANTNGTMRVRVTDVTSDSAHRGTVLFFKADGGGSTDITIDTSGAAPNLIQGSAIGDGIAVFIDGDPGTGVLQDGNARLLIRNTEISNHFSAGITLIVQDMDTAAGSFDATFDDVVTEQPTRADDVIVGSVELIAGGGGNGTLQVDLIDSVIGIGSVFLGTPLEGLVMRGDRDIDVVCNDDGNGGNGTPCTNIGTLTSDDTLVASIVNENGNQIDDGGTRDLVAADVFTSAALRNGSGEVGIVAPGTVTLPTLP